MPQLFSKINPACSNARFLLDTSRSIENALSEWRGGQEGFDDDITFLVLEYHAQTQNVQARTDSQSDCASPCSG